MVSHMIALLLSVTVATAQIQYGAQPYGQQQGPVLRTGRHRVIHDRILGMEHYGDTHNERPFEEEAEQENVAGNGQRFHYDRPIEGRKVYLYKRVHTPVRVTDGTIERLGPATVVDQWAEGGYQGAQRQNINVFHRVGNDVYQDRVVAVKNGFDGGFL